MRCPICGGSGQLGSFVMEQECSGCEGNGWVSEVRYGDIEFGVFEATYSSVMEMKVAHDDRNLQKVDLTSMDLRGEDLAGYNLSGQDLSGRDLSSIDLQEADLTGADLSRADLTGANLLQAQMASALLDGAILKKAYLSDHHYETDLRGVDLSQTKLVGAFLIAANISGRNLSGIDLSRVDLTGADISRANLSGATLAGVNLTDADLTDASLAGATLTGAALAGANLTGANLAKAQVRETNLSAAASLLRANLVGAVGLLPRQRIACIAKGAIGFAEAMPLQAEVADEGPRLTKWARSSGKWFGWAMHAHRERWNNAVVTFCERHEDFAGTISTTAATEALAKALDDEAFFARRLTEQARCKKNHLEVENYDDLLEIAEHLLVWLDHGGYEIRPRVSEKTNVPD